MELVKLMKDAGIVGAGGAGFPSYAKLAEGADTLLVNGAECEPLLYTDYIIMKNEMSVLLSGIKTVLDNTAISRAVIAIKAHTAKNLSLVDGEVLIPRVSVRILPDVYPMGDEISLIYEALGRLVQPGKLPITVGVIVNNVETLYNLGRAVRFSECVTDKWLTVGGNVPTPKVIKVPLGASVSDIFAKLGIVVPEGHSVLDGGPSMGKMINPSLAVVGKTTKGILILPDSTRAIESKRINDRMAVARAETACCQCTRCTDMCPRALLGYPLEPHRMVRTAINAAEVNPMMVLSATLCCGCGICESLACSQGISPRAVINNYKALLAKNKLRFSSNEIFEPKGERDYRKIPSLKWAQDLGVAKFYRIADFGGELSDFSRVRIPLNRHIGAPSVPVVKDGQRVERGEIIAEAANGLSVNQHASVSGIVTLADNEIIIDKVKYDV